MAAAVDKIAEITGGKDRSALEEDKMQSDAQARQAARQLRRFGAVALADHQARSREDAAAISNRDRFVHFARQAEVVCRDDQSLQCITSRRWRRNRKNSTASRSRFFITTGLRTMSPTISAILPERR